MQNKCVFSGIQPTGNLHLGNYLGAIKQWKKVLNDYEAIFSIVDLHAITVRQNPQLLRDYIETTAATYIACGINPKKSTIFVQSSVSGHAELAWILGCFTPIGWLNRMTQFKEKAGKRRENAPLGLYSYPVLMASDILLYNATHVPVGEDQKQHLELARDIAQSFNHNYFGNEENKYIFTMPEPLILDEAKRVMSLRDGTKKMSKSDESDLSRINLSDEPELILKKIKKAKTDSFKTLGENVKERPEAKNLIKIYAAISNKSFAEVCVEFSEDTFSSFKIKLADQIVAELEPIQVEIKKLKSDKTYLRQILDEGKEKASEIAEQNLRKIKEVIGFFI